MTGNFEAQKNRKAFLYTVAICALLLLLFIIVKWQSNPPSIPIVQDLIEVNLGNDMDGFGEEQPLIKGERGQAVTELAAADPASSSAATTNEQTVDAIEDNAKDEDATTIPPVEKINAPLKTSVTKPASASNINTNATSASPKPATSTSTAPKAATPQRPKLTYSGPGTGGGNNPTEDNGYRSQGNTPGAGGDAGSPNGDKDSYGTTPGGRTGGPKVIRGNRKVIRYYSFTGDLPKATIYAQVSVDPSGKGSFQKIVKPSTSFSSSYASAITSYLKNIEFDKSSQTSTVTVQFNFTVQ